MKINIETKYNTGDVLFRVNSNGDIEKVVIDAISINLSTLDTYIRYFFENGDNIYEEHMSDYCRSIEGAAQIIAQRAIDRLNNKEEIK